MTSLIGFIYVPVRRSKNVPNRSVHSIWDIMMSQHGPGLSDWSLEWVTLFRVLGSTFFLNLLWRSLSYQLVRCYNVLKTLVSFRYYLWRIWDVLVELVSPRYQLVRRFDVWNWLVLSTYQRDADETSRTGLSHSRTNCNVMIAPQGSSRRPDLYEIYDSM